MRKLVPILCALALLTACQKELCYDHPHNGADATHGILHVSFLWDDVQNPTASEMHLVAFADEQIPVIYPFSGMAGGTVSLWDGNYCFVAYNSDIETVTTRGDSYKDFEVCGIPRDITGYIRSFSKQLVKSDDSEIPVFPEGKSFIWEPERVWVTTGEDVKVTAGEEKNITLPMWAATYQYTFLIRNVDNLDRVASISAMLTGLATSYRPADRTPMEYKASEIFSFSRVDPTSIRGRLRVFGHSPDESGEMPAEVENQLTLFITMDNGNRYAYQFDVSEDMHNPDGSSIDTQTGEIVIDIRIENIPIPDQPTNPAGGFDIGIEDFITEEWDIYP